MSEQEFTIALCAERKTVGCAIIQAVLGATVPSQQLSRLDWDTSVDGMALYRITGEQLDRLTEQAAK